MRFFGTKNLFAKTCILYLALYFHVGAETTNLLEAEVQEGEEDSEEIYMNKIQNDYQAGMVTMVEFFGSLNSSLRAIERKLNFSHVINTSLESLNTKISVLEKKLDGISEYFAPFNASKGSLRISTVENSQVVVTQATVRSSTSCGGLVEVAGSSTSTIRFPNGGNYMDNERCVWTLAPKIKFASYKIKVDSANMEKNHDGVIIYYWDSRADLQSEKITEFGLWYFIPAPYFIVTFCSDGSGIGSGFSASIDGVGSSSDSATYRPIWLENPRGSFSYPEHLESYGSNELVGVVVHPKKDKSLEVSVSSANTGTDVIKIYNMNCQHCDSAPNYAMIGSGSGYNPSEISGLKSNSTYPRLVIFMKKLGSGFTLSFK